MCLCVMYLCFVCILYINTVYVLIDLIHVCILYINTVYVLIDLIHVCILSVCAYVLTEALHYLRTL